jgi:RNA polymerase sigma factor (sigma-70 family)
LTDDELVYRQYRRFFRFGRARALRETAEEFAAFAIAEWLQTRRANAQWLWVDYVREQCGRDERINGDGLGARCERGRVEVTEALQIAVPPEPHAERIDARRLLHQVDGRTRRILEAVFWEGRTQRETGERLGIAESRVSQILASTITKLRRKYLMDNLDDVTYDDVLLAEDDTTARHESADGIAEALAAADDTPTALAPPTLEPRNCTGCGSTFRVLISSPQKYCSGSCEAKSTGVAQNFGWKAVAARGKADDAAREKYHARVKHYFDQGLSVAKISAALIAEGVKTATGAPASPANVQNVVSKLKGKAKLAKRREVQPTEKVIPVELHEVPAAAKSVYKNTQISTLPALALSILESGDLSDSKKVRMLLAYAED